MAFDPESFLLEEEEPSSNKTNLTGFDPDAFLAEDETIVEAPQIDRNYFTPKPLRTEKEKQEIGTLEGISNAAKNAFDSSRQAMDVVGGVTPEEAKNIAKIEFDKKSRKLAPGYDEYQKAEGVDAVWAFAKNPIEVTSNIIAEGLAGSLPALGAGLTAGGVGAAAGSVIPVLGTAAGFTAGQVAGTFAGSLATEYGGKVLEELQGEGMDISDPNSIQTFFGNEELVGKARDKALKRGVPIAAFDAVSAGIGGKLGRIFGTKAITEGGKIIGKEFATKTGEALTELGTQAFLGAGGEVAGALAAGETPSVKAAFGEAIGEVGTGGVEVITGRIADKRAMAKAQEDAKIKAAANLSTTLEENSSPLTAKVVTAKSATSIEQDKLAAQLEEELSLTAAKPTAAPPIAIPTKDEYVARYSAIAETAPEELTRAEQSFTNELASADTEEKRINAQNALDAIKEVKATVTPSAPTVNAIERINQKRIELDNQAKKFGSDSARQFNTQNALREDLPEEQKAFLNDYANLNAEIRNLTWRDASELSPEQFSIWEKPKFTEKAQQEQDLTDLGKLALAHDSRGDAKKAEKIKSIINESKRKSDWTIDSWAERFDESKTQEEINEINSQSIDWNDSIDSILEIIKQRTKPVTPAVPTAQPTTTYATEEIIQPEGVRQEPQDGTQIGKTAEAGVGRGLLGAARGEEEGQVDPVVAGLKAVANNTATNEQIASLSLSGLVDVRRGQAIINEDGEGILAQAQVQLPTLTPEERAAEVEATPRPLPTDALPTETPGATYGRESELFDVFAGVRRRPVDVTEPTIREIPQASPMIGEQPVEPIISEKPKTSELVGEEPAAIVEQEQVTPAEAAVARPSIISEASRITNELKQRWEQTAPGDRSETFNWISRAEVELENLIGNLAGNENAVARQNLIEEITGTKPTRQNSALKNVRQAIRGYLQANPLQEAATPTVKVAAQPESVTQVAGVPPLVKELITAGRESAAQLRARISNVKIGPIENNVETFTFDIDGQTYRGELKGRNRNLVLGTNPTADTAIATRVLLDKNATPITPVTTPPVTEAVTPAAEQPAVSIPASGKPFEFFSIRNKEKAPRLGTQFGQDVEPSGKYISQSTPDAAKNLDARFEKKTVRFENPLVVEFGGEYGTPTNWKNVLSSQYGGKTGIELSQAIRDAGYDGIVTVEPSRGANRPATTSEIVDIREIQPTITPIEPESVEAPAITPAPVAPAPEVATAPIPVPKQTQEDVKARRYSKFLGESAPQAISEAKNALSTFKTTILGKRGDSPFQAEPRLRELKNTISLFIANRLSVTNQKADEIAEQIILGKPNIIDKVTELKPIKAKELDDIGAIRSSITRFGYELDDKKTYRHPREGEVTTPIPAVSETITPAEPEGISVGNRIKLGKSPQTYIVEEVLPQSESEKANEEQFYSVKNERTGEVQVVEARDLKPVKKMPIRKAIADAVPTPDDKLVPAKDIINAVIKMFGKDFVGEYLTLIDDVNEKAKAAYEISSGTIYINRAYLSTDDNIRDYIAHELGHYIAGDPTMTAKFQEFFDSLPAKDKAKLDRFVENVYNDETGEVRLEEKQVYAFIMRLNAGENRNAFQTLMDAIKKWLNKNFKTKFKMTDRDAAAILAGAVERFKSGEFIPREEGFGTREAVAALFPKTEEESNAFEKASSNKVMQRNPQLAVAAVRLKNGEITADEYAGMIDAFDPFVAKGPDPIPTDDKIKQYIQSDKVGKVGLIDDDGNQRLQSGSEYEFRIDIPTYNRSTAAGDTVYAITAHLPVADEAKTVGEVVAFSGIAKVKNPKFMTRNVREGGAITIAMGSGKFRLATVKGKYEPIVGLPADINDSNIWTEVAYNPIRSSYFVDVRSKNAVIGGDEAIMVGSRVFVKNPQMQPRPTGIVGGQGVKDIRYAKAVGEPRREQVAGKERGDIITTPEGIIKQTNEVLRNKFFDGSVVSDENTGAAWNYIEQLLDIKSGAANALAGQINDVVDQETNSDSRMGASLFSVSLANYAAKLAAQGDNTMISYLIRRINRMPVDNLAGGISEAAEAMRAKREYNIDGYNTLKTEGKSKVERTAATLFGTDRPSEEQVKAVDAAIKESEDTSIGEPEEVAAEIEKVEKRTKRKVISKIEDQISGNIEEKRKAALDKQKTRPATPSSVERQALSVIDQLARIQSDTPAFSEKQENLIKSIVQQDLRQKPRMNRKEAWTNQLTAKLIQAGASEAQALTISDLVWRQHEIKAMDRELKELQTAAEKGSLAVIIQRIKDTPIADQQKPEWMQSVIRDYLVEAGLSEKAAVTAARLYESVIAERFAEAKQKAFEDTLSKSAPWKNYLSRNAQLGKNALKKIQDAIRVGVLDPTQTTEGIIAKENGWSGFSKEQLTRIVQLDGVISDPETDQVFKAEAMSELNKIIVKAKMPVRFRDAISSYYVGQALMGIPTFTVNIASPTFFAVRNLAMDVVKYAATDPRNIPVAFQSFINSFQSLYDNSMYAFKNQIYMSGEIEYMQGQNVLSELFDKGKEQWAKGDYANGMFNMLVGATQITGRILSSLDQGAIEMMQSQNITRYTLEAMKGNRNIPKEKRSEIVNIAISGRRKIREELIASGMAPDRAGVLAELKVRSELTASLSGVVVRATDVLNASLNDALQSVGRNRAITINSLKQEQNNLRDAGILSGLAIGFLENIAQGASKSSQSQQVFAKMLYGFALVPARVFSTAAWFSPIGFVRLGIDAALKSKGIESRYALSLATELQQKQRFIEAVAGSALLFGLGAALSSSTDDDEDKFFKIVVTGNGPDYNVDKQYHDSWHKNNKPQSVAIWFGKTKTTFNIGRGGESISIPLLFLGGLDDARIKQKLNQARKSPADFEMVAEAIGSAFYGLAQRGPFAAFTKPLFDAKQSDKFVPKLFGQVGFLGKTFVPVLGTSIARNISDFINDPIDKSSVQGAIYSNIPIVGPAIGTKALNAFGQPIRADDWGDKLFKLGVPVVMSFPKNTPENELNQLVLKKGDGPPIPTRTNAQKKFEEPLTDKEFEIYVREYGRVVSEKMFKNRKKLENMDAKNYTKELDKYVNGYSIDEIKITGASDMAVRAVKRLRNE